MYVIFDTNVYREYTYGLNEAEAKTKFEKIKAAETRKGITPALSTVTAMELLAHLADKSDPAFEFCKIAAIAAGYHLLRPPGEVSIVPHPQIQLQYLIFGDYDEGTITKFEIVGEIINFLNKGPVDHYIEEFTEQLKEINRLVNLHEQDFKTTMLSVIQGIDPLATSWTALQSDKAKRQRFLKYLTQKEQEAIDITAMGYVQKTIKARRKPLSVHESAMAAINVANYFHAALRLHLAIMQKMLVGGFDMDNKKRNRQNTIWDIYQLFSVSASTMNEKEVLFVTADRWLHEICVQSGLEKKILYAEDYFAMIGVSLS